MGKVGKFVMEIIEEMEKRGFSDGETRCCAKMLGKELKKNSERKDYHKPFTVFRYPTDCSDQ